MNKTISNIFIILLLIILIICSFFILKKNSDIEKNKTKINFKTSYNKNNTVNIVVENNSKDIQYSFDNGKTWQKENSFIVTKNGTYNIKIKDDKGIIKSTKCTINEIDVEGPELSINLPQEILIGEKIDLADYVKITNNDKLSGNIVITPNKIDTSTKNDYYITYSATDIYGNTSTKEVKIRVVDKANNSVAPIFGNVIKTTDNKTYYRYRTKKTITYDCNEYDCSYLDDSTKKSADVKYNNPDCPNGGAYINNPCPIGSSCTANMVSSNNSKGNICYSRNYIYGKNSSTNTGKEKTECTDGEIKIGDYCHKIMAIGTYPEGCTDSSCVEFPSGPCNGDDGPEINTPCPIGKQCVTVMTNTYKRYQNYCYNVSYIYNYSSNNAYDKYGNKVVCDSDEIKIGNYCHKIIEKGSYYCNSNEELKDGYCYSKIIKSCYNSCKKDVWSEWSDWSTIPVSPSLNVDVETKSN